MSETSLKNNQLRKDLLVILVLSVIMFGTLGLIMILDANQGVIAEWSSAFYQFLLKV